MSAVGISFNTLSLFGLVLAIGIVVDDAIVVVENVERYLTQGMSPKAAAHKTMDEVGGALIAISTVISAINSLTLSPALSALLLKGHHEPKDRLTLIMAVSPRHSHTRASRYSPRR